MKLDRIHRVYFVGIGGIGMSALARYFVAKGVPVFGYDKTPSKVTESLEKLGISISFLDSEESLPKEIKQQADNTHTLVVYTPAIPLENNIIKYFRQNAYVMLKRAQVLGVISKDTFCMSVAGTHGKTTTSALLGHIMKECKTGASSFIGGILNGYNSNLILGNKNISVMEADEYDRSFMELSPNIACITSMDADHLDIYGDYGELEQTFKKFAKLVEKGKLICKEGLKIEDAITYSVEGTGDYNASNIIVKNGAYEFDISNKNKEIYKNIKSTLPGKYNIENTLAAFAMAEQYGLNSKDILAAIESFRGIYRRYNVFKYKEKTIVDDYAHHPSEIDAVLKASRELFENKKIMIIFQPHLFSRTRDFEDNFIEALSNTDSLRLLDIYPARELPIKGVSSNVLLSKIEHCDKKIISKKDIPSEIKTSSAEVILMLGAGDISVEIEKLKKYSGK